MVILRHQIIGTSSKGAVNELVVVNVCCDKAQAEVRVYELHILLIILGDRDCGGR